VAVLAPARQLTALALGCGQLLEIFVGSAAPTAFDLRIADDERFRSVPPWLNCSARSPWRSSRDQILGGLSGEKSQRRERFAAVMAGQRDYSSGRTRQTNLA